MLTNKLCWLLLFFVGIVFAQEKKVDTVFIYEEIIVHDTVFIEKPLEDMVIRKAEILPKKNGKSLLKLFLKNKQIILTVDSLIVTKDIKKTQLENKKSSWVFGAKTGFGLISNSFLQQFDNSNQSNATLSVFTRKKIGNNFSLGTSLDVSMNLKSTSINTVNNPDLNGYFSINQMPLVFQSIKGKSTLLQVPIQIYYTFEKWIPSIGISGQRIKYDAIFWNTNLQENQNFIAQSYQLGYVFELSYVLSKHFAIYLNYQTYNSKELTFENKSDSSIQITTNSPINYKKIQVGFCYFL